VRASVLGVLCPNVHFHERYSGADMEASVLLAYVGRAWADVSKRGPNPEAAVLAGMTEGTILTHVNRGPNSAPDVHEV